jgi:two-component system copper resistance phosphate regulon response regulator CusR
MKLLIIEDDAEISSALRAGLEDAGHFVEVVRDGERGLRVALAGQFAVIVLDLMLPSLDGITLCKRLRATKNTTPVLMLTARDTVEDRVTGLESGADDYLVKPFSFDEFLARVRALLRRDTINKSARIEIADLVVDTAAKVVARAGRKLDLTAREYSLLEALAQRQGQILSRERILHGIWVDEFSTSNTVDVHVKNLRKKVDEGHELKLIHTVFGTGYVLRIEDESPS